MISRRQFIFDIAAGTAALSTSPSIVGQMGSALLSPAPAAAAPVFASNFMYVNDSLLGIMQRTSHRNLHHLTLNPGSEVWSWYKYHALVLQDSICDFIDLMHAAKIQDLDTTLEDAHKICMEMAKDSAQGYHPCNYAGPLNMMHKFASHETIHAQIPEILEKNLHELAHVESLKPPELQARSVSIDNMHMALLLKPSPSLHKGTTYTGFCNTFSDLVEGLYYTYTANNLKFLAELHFLQQNNFLARIFTLPDKEQSILDIFEANPANWSQLLLRTRYESGGQEKRRQLNEAFPERAENAKIYTEILEKLKDSVSDHQLPSIEVPWDIVVQMQNKPDAFMPLMRTAIEESKEDLAKSYRKTFSENCKGKTTFTQTAPRETGFQGLQGTLRGFFAVYPDKETIFNMLKDSFSAAVNLRIDGNDILLEATPEMSKEDRLLIENLAGKDEAIPVFQQVLPQTLPVIMANAPADRQMF